MNGLQSWKYDKWITYVFILLILLIRNLLHFYNKFRMDHVSPNKMVMKKVISNLKSFKKEGKELHLKMQFLYDKLYYSVSIQYR
jgi:hypothetical protein